MNRDLFWQSVRGLCIILVVLIHLPLGLESDDSFAVWLGVRNFINFPVATFVFLSAYFCKYKRGDSILPFFGRRLRRLLIPYLIFAVLYIVIVPYLQNGHISDNAIFELFTGYGPTYFLLVLVQFTLITPIIVNTLSKPSLRWINYIITPVYIAIYYFYNFKTGEELKASQTCFAAWYIFYYLGFVIRNAKVRLPSSLSLFSLMIFCMVLSEIESYSIFKYLGEYSFAISQIKISSILSSLTVILLFVKFAGYQHKATVLSELGDYSMGIFLLHHRIEP